MSTPRWLLNTSVMNARQNLKNMSDREIGRSLGAGIHCARRLREGRNHETLTLGQIASLAEDLGASPRDLLAPSRPDPSAPPEVDDPQDVRRYAGLLVRSMLATQGTVRTINLRMLLTDGERLLQWTEWTAILADAQTLLEPLGMHLKEVPHARLVLIPADEHSTRIAEAIGQITALEHQGLSVSEAQFTRGAQLGKSELGRADNRAGAIESKLRQLGVLTDSETTQLSPRALYSLDVHDDGPVPAAD